MQCQLAHLNRGAGCHGHGRFRWCNKSIAENLFGCIHIRSIGSGEIMGLWAIMWIYGQSGRCKRDGQRG